MNPKIIRNKQGMAARTSRFADADLDPAALIFAIHVKANRSRWTLWRGLRSAFPSRPPRTSNRLFLQHISDKIVT